ncbi:MAG: class I SAM-dependent methyltransferase [Flavobacteriales bacterium]|nr:class I SAM-dependent methyltransferase [Flavobacteriales bacterium]
MDVRTAYNAWSEQYDTNANRTRDLEATVLREVLNALPFARVLEIGCGTGKNTEWLAQRSKHITAVDLSEGMLARAREKVALPHVRFVQADILQPWTFRDGAYDLVTFSLVLEHVEHLGPVLKEGAMSLATGGHLYVGELHPFKQYAGTKARFETEAGTQVVTCYDHHTSDFLNSAMANGLELVHLGEHFHDDDKTGPPWVLSLLLRKS